MNQDTAGITTSLVDDLVATATKLDEVRKENTRLRAALATSKDPCIYCQLPAEKWGECQSGFPGCARADDMSGCPEFGASLHLHDMDVYATRLRAVLVGLVESVRMRRRHLGSFMSPSMERELQLSEEAALKEGEELLNETGELAPKTQAAPPGDESR